MKDCPIPQGEFHNTRKCQEIGCAWWCDDYKCCSIKKISIELIKIEEAIKGGKQ